MNNNNGVFIGGGADWHNNAQLMHELSRYSGSAHRWAVYAYGYKEAADRLVAGINERQGWQDFLLYPILYLYRHYLEVMVKGQIRDAQKLLGIERPVDRKEKRRHKLEAAEGHDILALWGYLLSLVYQLHPEQSPAQMAEGTRVIAAFSELDATGDAFRYPETLHGHENLTKIPEINLRHLRDEMERAGCALTQIEGVLDYQHDQNQQASEYEQDLDQLHSEYLSESGPIDD